MKRAIDGTYNNVEIDKAARTLLSAPVPADLTDEGQGNIYICGPANSVGRFFFYPGTETLAEDAVAMGRGLFNAPCRDDKRTVPR